MLGIQPRWAETGYGYIEFGKSVEAGSGTVEKVQSFREKPDAKTAKKFVAAGRFFWNAGMFFWKAGTVLEALRQHQPKTWTLLAALPAFGKREFSASVAESFPRCENISIDYAVLEKAKNVVGIAVDDIGWNDVGSWNAVYELLDSRRRRQRAVSAMRSCRTHRKLRGRQGQTGGAARCERSDRGGHAGRAADRRPESRAGSRER